MSTDEQAQPFAAALARLRAQLEGPPDTKGGTNRAARRARGERGGRRRS